MEIGGFLGMGGHGVSLSAAQQEQVAIGSTVPPELSGGAAEQHLPQTAYLLFWASVAYLAIFVFHVVTY